jgi:hypothetical protein
MIMGLTNAAIMTGATACTITPTGGTTQTFSPDGLDVTNGLHIADVGQSDVRLQRTITVRNRRPTLQPSGKWSKWKRFITIITPYLKADGTIVNNYERIEREFDPETPAAVVLSNRYVAAQALVDSDFDGFHNSGSLS